MASSDDMAPSTDLKAARATYLGFLHIIKVALPIIAVIGATVIYLLSH